jgi:hypothetical protein
MQIHGFFWNKQSQTYMVLVNAFYNYNSSFAFSAWEAVGPINVYKVSNVSLSAGPHLYI